MHRTSLSISALAGIVTLVLVACSASTASDPTPAGAALDAGADASAADPDASGATPRPSHAPLPSVTNQHGRVFAQAELVTVTFPRYAYEARVRAFGEWVVGSSWLHGVCPEYGCGAKSHQSITLTEEAPQVISPAALEAMLVRLVDAGTLPAPSDDTLYLVYFPGQTVLSILQQGPPGCDSGSAFHGSVRIGGRLVPYTGVADCTAHPSSKAMFPKLSAEEIVEVASSHEIIEALTDPFFPPTPSLLLDDFESPWFALGGEVADWCAGFTAREGEHVVTRVWSNEQARLGRHPCVPAPGGAVYFNAAPSESKVVSVPRGGSVDIPVTGWATSPIAPWALRLIQPPIGPDGLATTMTLSSSTIGDGGVVTLHVGVPADAPVGASRFFMLASARPEDEWFHMWPMIVRAK